MRRHRQHQIRVHERQLPIHRTFAIPCQERPRGDELRRRKHDDVLPVEGKDLGVRPDERTNPVDNRIAVRSESLRPVIRPLLVDVIRPALVWNGRGKEDARRVLDDVSHEPFCTVLRQMLCNLECDCKLELADEIERSVEARRDKSLVPKVQRVSWHPRAVDADVVVDPVKCERLEPDTEPTAKVGHAPRAYALHDNRHDRLGRTSRPINPPGEELRRVRLVHGWAIRRTK